MMKSTDSLHMPHTPSKKTMAGGAEVAGANVELLMIFQNREPMFAIRDLTPLGSLVIASLTAIPEASADSP